MEYCTRRWPIELFQVNRNASIVLISSISIILMHAIDFFSFDLDPTVRHTWFSLIFGGGFTYATLYACNQTQVQRLLTVKNLKASQKAMFLNWPILSLLSLSTCFSGLSLYAYYHKCDPKLDGRIDSRDQA